MVQQIKRILYLFNAIGLVVFFVREENEWEREYTVLEAADPPHDYQWEIELL